MRGLRRVRAGLPCRGHLLRRRCAGSLERIHPDQRLLLRRTGITWRRVEGRPDRQRSAVRQGPAASGTGRITARPDVVRRGISADLPVFPWDTLADATALARSHPDGIVDLSVGTPVDPVAPLIRDALAAASSAPGYPTTAGTPALRASAVAALSRRYGVTGLSDDAVLPVIGTKELIAWLPTLLGLGRDDLVVVPELAYPTYEVGARLAGTPFVRADSLTQLGPQSPALVFLNSPSNPTGKVLGVDHLRKVVGWARDRGALIASDECYLGLGWDAAPLSVLHPSVCDGDHTGLLAIPSLSKTSSLAGYRAGFVAGDQSVVAELL